jgi:hypothetical protein
MEPWRFTLEGGESTSIRTERLEGIASMGQIDGPRSRCWALKSFGTKMVSVSSYGASMESDLSDLKSAFRFKIDPVPTEVSTTKYVWPLTIYDQKKYPICTSVTSLALVHYALARSKFPAQAYSYSMTYLCSQLLTRSNAYKLEKQFLAGLPLSATLQSVITFGVFEKLGSEEDHDPDLMLKYITEQGHNLVTYVQQNSARLMENSLKVIRLYPSIPNLRQALNSGYPVAFSIRIDVRINNWFTDKNLQSESSFIVPMPSVLGRVATHAVYAIGADDRKKVFKIQNSMGQDFGDNGFCYITYSAILDYGFTGLSFYIIG